MKQIDVSNQAHFREELEELIEGETGVILDLINVQFMDSTGLGIIVSALRRMKESKRNLIICNPSQAVHLLFEMVRLSQITTVCTDRDEAVRILQS